MDAGGSLVWRARLSACRRDLSDVVDRPIDIGVEVTTGSGSGPGKYDIQLLLRYRCQGGVLHRVRCHRGDPGCVSRVLFRGRCVSVLRCPANQRCRHRCGVKQYKSHFSPKEKKLPCTRRGGCLPTTHQVPIGTTFASKSNAANDLTPKNAGRSIRQPQVPSYIK